MYSVRRQKSTYTFFIRRRRRSASASARERDAALAMRANVRSPPARRPAGRPARVAPGPPARCSLPLRAWLLRCRGSPGLVPARLPAWAARLRRSQCPPGAARCLGRPHCRFPRRSSSIRAGRACHGWRTWRRSSAAACCPWLRRRARPSGPTSTYAPSARAPRVPPAARPLTAFLRLKRKLAARCAAESERCGAGGAQPPAGGIALYGDRGPGPGGARPGAAQGPAGAAAP